MTANHDDDWPYLRANDPPRDLSREEAAYARERERLLRDHLGKYALIYQDRVVAVYDDLDKALYDGMIQFGPGRIVVRPIEHESGEEDFVTHVDINHPSVRRLD